MRLDEIVQLRLTDRFTCFEGWLSNHKDGSWSYCYRGQRGKVESFDKLVETVPEFRLIGGTVFSHETVFNFIDGRPEQVKGGITLNRVQGFNTSRVNTIGGEISDIH